MKKLGMRTIKTGISVFLCAWIGAFLVDNILNVAIACMLSIQDTVKDSLKAGLTRIKGTILGGIIGFILVSIAPGYPLVCGLGVILTIYICNLLDLNEGISIACITFLSIHLGTISTNPINYSIDRVIDTSVGVVIGLTVNLILARPDYFKITTLNLIRVHSQIEKYIEFKALKKCGNFKFNILDKSLQDLENSYEKLIYEIHLREDNSFAVFEESISYYKEIYSHIQSIEFLEKKQYFSSETYNYLKLFYNEDDIKYEVSDNKSQVFNFHFMKIIELLDKINNLNLNTYKIRKCKSKKHKHIIKNKKTTQ